MFKKLFGNKKMLADVILIASLLLVALSVFLIVSLNREEGARVAVSVDGERVAEYPLSESGEYIINGGTNILVIEDGKAYLRYSDCPDKTCMLGHSIFGKKIFYVGERIVCLPNRVMIEIVGKGDELNFDF